MENKELIPYDYRALIIWGIIASFLFTFAQYLLTFSLILGIIFIVVSISFGLIIDYKLTKKQNQLQGITSFTPMQILIFKITISIFIFLSIFSILSLQINEYNFIYILWIFLIGIFSLTLSFLTNSNTYNIHAKILIATSILLLLLSIFLTSEFISLLSQIFCIVEIGFGYIGIGILKNIESKTQN